MAATPFLVPPHSTNRQPAQFRGIVGAGAVSRGSWPEVALVALLVFPTALVSVPGNGVAYSFASLALAGLCLLYPTVVNGSATGGIGPAFRWWVPWAPVVCGLLQLALGTTAYPAATVRESLHWAGLAAVFLMARSLLADADRRERFLTIAGTVAATHALLAVAQLFSSQGRILWLFNTASTEFVYGVFPSRNNYAQWVELLLPVCLWCALTRVRQRVWWTLASGLLLASVVASASRAGVAVSLAEIALVLLFTSGRTCRDGGRLAVAAMVPLVAAAGTLVVGWERVWHRFLLADPFAGRREILIAALRMARDFPLAGAGLGTFASVYPQYAVAELPGRVNAAHNDWVEFLATGGLLLLVAVAVWFSPILPIVKRHAWSVGVAGVCVHALVDFPFAREAVSGWMVALFGAASAAASAAPGPRLESPNELRRWRAAAPYAFRVCLLAGAAFAATLAWADWLSRSDEPARVREAIRWNPGEASYYTRLSELDPAGGVLQLTAQALARNRFDAETWIDRGLELERLGRLPEADEALDTAARYDQTFLPRWTLANYYFRRDDFDSFWKWAQAAAARAGDRDLKPLFQLALRAVRANTGADDPREVARRLADGRARTEVLRQFVEMLVKGGGPPDDPAANLPRQTLDALAATVPRLIADGTADRDTLLALQAADRLLDANRVNEARSLWTALGARAWLAPAGLSSTVGHTLPPFRPKQVGPAVFDWRFYPYPGLLITPGVGNVRLRFSGAQPETVVAAEAVLAVDPGQRYRLGSKYQFVAEDHSDTGVRWRIVDFVTRRLLADSESLVADSGPRHKKAETRTVDVEFTPPGSAVRVWLFAERARASTRIEGELELDDVRTTVVSTAHLPGQPAAGGPKVRAP